MRFAAFFRNLNIGRPRSPSKMQLMTAFTDAGAGDAVSVRSHGNVVFSARGARHARAIAESASRQLRRVCGLDEPVFVRSLAYLADLALSERFAAAPDDAIHERCVTFLPAGIGNLPAVPIVTARRDAEVFLFQAGEAFGVTRLVGGRPGPVNAMLERILKTRLTTRSWSTLAHIVTTHA